MSNPEPCKLCGADAYVVQVPMSPRGGDTEIETTDARRCTNPDCPSNAGTARAGDEV